MSLSWGNIVPVNIHAPIYIHLSWYSSSVICSIKLSQIIQDVLDYRCILVITSPAALFFFFFFCCPILIHVTLTTHIFILEYLFQSTSLERWYPVAKLCWKTFSQVELKPIFLQLLSISLNPILSGGCKMQSIILFIQQLYFLPRTLFKVAVLNLIFSELN